MNKKADIWISAVLYTGLGVILLSIILAVGIPVINKIRDKNTAIETENLMLSLDSQIRAVYTEGPGSRRPFKFEVNKGNLEVDEDQETIIWTFETTALLSEPGIPVKKGNLILLTEETGNKDIYTSSFKLNYKDVLNLKLQSAQATFTGSNSLLISNSGTEGTPPLPTISITSI